MDADRLLDLRRLHEHLTAADQLAEKVGLVYETRTFPFRVFRNIVGGMLTADPHEDTRRLTPPEDPAAGVARELLADADPIAHPTPDQT